MRAMGDRRLVRGVLATLAGGSFWGLSGTSASFLFAFYKVDTAWLTCVRQVLAGLLFLVVILVRDRRRLIELWTTKRDRRVLYAFTLCGLLLNQFFYLWTVRITNPGTATVLQCLSLVFIMAFACVAAHRRPKRREIAGLALAFGGTFLIATGGSLDSMSIPPEGLVLGLVTALSAASMAIIPVRILPKYGSSIVTGSGMLCSGVVTSAFVQPWRDPPVLDPLGWQALAVLVVVGSFLAYFLYMQGVTDLGSVRASLLGTVEPVSATVTSAIVLGTVFAPTDIAGFVLIIAMVFLTV
ncbi:DMT family transporter [Coriobacterium glomerans]|nr:EamA family transporter [Coriobacterium glomerans]